MTDEDFVYVLKNALRSFDDATIRRMVEVNKRVAACNIRDGGPFEFNLRDLFRWSEATAKVRTGEEGWHRNARTMFSSATYV